MEKVSKFEWLKALKGGFTPKYEVKKTSHGRYYYLMQPDYNKFIAFIQKKN